MLVHELEAKIAKMEAELAELKQELSELKQEEAIDKIEVFYDKYVKMWAIVKFNAKDVSIGEAEYEQYQQKAVQLADKLATDDTQTILLYDRQGNLKQTRTKVNGEWEY